MELEDILKKPSTIKRLSLITESNSFVNRSWRPNSSSKIYIDLLNKSTHLLNKIHEELMIYEKGKDDVELLKEGLLVTYKRLIDKQKFLLEKLQGSI